MVLSRVSKKSDPSVKYNAEELGKFRRACYGRDALFEKGRIAVIEDCVNLRKLKRMVMNFVPLTPSTSLRAGLTLSLRLTDWRMGRGEKPNTIIYKKTKPPRPVNKDGEA